jgi:hypothetical protein
MRIVLPLLALLSPAMTLAADTPAPAETESVRPTVRELKGPPEPANCRDRIHAVREERSLPKLERDTASPDEPLFIAAVDKRIGGCSVLVMRQNLSDVRPLPALPQVPPRLMPAR